MSPKHQSDTALRPYARYRNTGNPWLGAIPEHWSLRSLGSLTRSRNVRGRAELPLLSVVRERGVILRSSMTDEENHNFVPDDRSNYKVARKGDLVINKMKAWQGSLGLAPTDGVVSPAYFVFELSIDVRAYAQALLRSRRYVAFFAQASDGVRIGQWDLSPAGMKRIPVCVPPAREQSAIVNFLNHTDGRIKRYIATKRKLIALLNEQRQSIVYRAVTAGLGMSPALKPLGSAPTHDINLSWPVMRLWQLARLRSEKNRPDLALLSVFLGRGVIRYGEGGGQVHKPSLDLAGYQVVHPGDLVLNNQQAWRGSVGVSPHHGIISPAYVVLTLDKQLEPRFADYLFKSRVMVSQFVTASKGVGDIQRDIHMPWLKNVRVPVPPRDEQLAIASQLDDELRDLNNELSHYERQLELILEYRTNLITEVATGKIDVLAAASELGERGLDHEPSDELIPLAGGEEELSDDPDVVEQETEA